MTVFTLFPEHIGPFGKVLSASQILKVRWSVVAAELVDVVDLFAFGARSVPRGSY
jgi:hypothetical protein